MTDEELHDKLSGILFGTAVGDALGLMAEGLSAQEIARRFGRLEHYCLLGDIGLVTDDTEQTALVADALAHFPNDCQRFTKLFRSHIAYWFCTLPPGIGKATFRACMRILVGVKNSGINSAGNGAAMRAAIVGGFFHDQPKARHAYGEALALTTHNEPRAVAGALFAADVAAAAMTLPNGSLPLTAFDAALEYVSQTDLRNALVHARTLAINDTNTLVAAEQLGNSGYVVHTLGLAAFCFLRFGTIPILAITETISAGGDTDTVAAIVGAWCGALCGQQRLPEHLVKKLYNGGAAPTDLNNLAECLVKSKQQGTSTKPRPFCFLLAFVRNILITPVLLFHALRRFLP